MFTLDNARKQVSRLLSRSGAPAGKSTPRSQRAHLGLEALESRDLMSGSPILNSSYLPDPSILKLAQQDFSQHGSVNFNDMITIYGQVQKNGSLTSAEVTSLSNLATFGSYVNTPGYVQFLENKVIFGDPANAPFGNLRVGSSATQVGQVSGEWFLGTDLPSLVSGEGSYANHYDPSGNVFGGGLTYTQVSQGQVGDCTLMASMAEVAARLPGDIYGMFIFDGNYNGTSVWTVRLFEGSSSFYVTVNSELPSAAANPVGGALWAPLAEKAFAQANASGWLKTVGTGDSYAAINNGNSTTVVTYLSALTGLKSSSWDVVTNGVAAVSASYIQQELQAGKLVVVATGSNQSVLNNDIVPNHCYAVVGYNASSSLPFEVYNPWGLGAYTTYDGHTVFGSTFICNAAFLQQNFVFWGVDSPSY